MNFSVLLTVEDISRRILFDRRAKKRRDNAAGGDGQAKLEAQYFTDRRGANIRRGEERRQQPKVRNFFWYILIFWTSLSILVTLSFTFTPAYIEQMFPNSNLMTLKFTYYIFSVSLFLTLSLLYNQFRNRRRSDKANFFMIVSTSLSIIFLAIYLMLNFHSLIKVLAL